MDSHDWTPRKVEGRAARGRRLVERNSSTFSTRLSMTSFRATSTRHDEASGLNTAAAGLDGMVVVPTDDASLY